MTKKANGELMTNEGVTGKELMSAQQDFTLAQRARLRAYIEATQPELAAAYEEQVRSFVQVTDSVLEPALRSFVEHAQSHGIHMLVVRESPAEGIFGIATPGIRLLVSRNPLPNTNIDAFFGQTSFVGFHGRCPTPGVEMITETHSAGASSDLIRSERVLDYEGLDVELVRSLVADIIPRLA